MIRIIWHGHACFEVREENMNTVFDPHDGTSIGLPKPRTKGDIILVTHDHFDHNAIDVVKEKESIIIDRIFNDYIKGIKIETREEFHDESMGRERGKIRIYKVKIKKYVIAHLGDLGRIPEMSVIDWLKDVDVLLIPVGGTFTIDGKQAAKLIKMINPKIAIPMHYKVPGLSLPIADISNFINSVKKYVENIEFIDNNIYELKELPNQTKIVILQPPR